MLPYELEQEYKYRLNDESILDMSTSTWQNMSVANQGERARQWQLGYAKATGLELEIVSDPGRANIAMVLIPPGRFLQTCLWPEFKIISLEAFYLSKTPVTQGQWESVMGSNPAYFKKAGPSAPVERVDWEECQNFCQKLGGNLPSTAEWEFAARAGSTLPYFFSTDPNDLGFWGWYRYNAWWSTRPVAQKQPNAYGLYDIIGNVMVWCLEEKTPPGKEHEIRGTSWEDDRENSFVCSNDKGWREVGLRLCLPVIK